MHSRIIQSLTQSHRRMERVLTLIRVQIVMLHSGIQEEAFLFLKNAIGYMRDYPALCHHPAEDILFDRLAACRPGARALCRRLTEQHQEFLRQETSLFRHIHSARKGDIGACRHIEQVGAAYCVEHATHISSEEAEAFPQAIECLKDADWCEIREQAQRTVDPLADWQKLKRFENLYDFLMA